jgi:hypothetical protein
MQNRSKPPIRKLAGKSGSEASLFVMSWGLGMMSGVVASAIAVMCALALGYLSLGVQVVSAQESLSSPANTIVEVLGSPTQLAEASMDGTPTVTGHLLPSATPTPPATILPTTAPNYIATATQACSLFQSKFPGTPCPRFNTPTP